MRVVRSFGATLRVYGALDLRAAVRAVRETGALDADDDKFSTVAPLGTMWVWKLDGEESKTYSTSSSTRTSPTTNHAQAASMRRDVASNDHGAAADFADVESGVTPKGTSGFWQAAFRYE